MKTYFLFICAICCYLTGNAHSTEYNIFQFGASKDTSVVQTQAINAAIENCHRQGGGKVIIPSGIYKSGTIFLKDNVELHLESGAYLYASDNYDDFPVQPQASYRSQKDAGGWVSLIYAVDAKNISITGKGTIDGKGKGRKGRISGLGGDRNGRPRNILFISCKDVHVEGITMRNSALWNQHYLNCEDVTIDHIKVYNHSNGNNDGIDIDGCRRFILSNSIIDSDDDGIVLKSTGTAPCENVIISNCIVSSFANAIKCGTESTGGFKNISISDCIVKPSRHSGERILKSTPSGITAISLEIVDGGIMDGVTINNVLIEGTECPLYIRLANRGRQYPDDAPVPPVGRMRNIQISNITAYGTGNFCSSITGIENAKIENIYLNNIRFMNRGGLVEGAFLPDPAMEGKRHDVASGTKWNRYWSSFKEVKEDEKGYPQPTVWGNLPSYGLFIRNVENITVNDATFMLEKPDPRIPVIAVNVGKLQMNRIQVDSRKTDTDVLMHNVWQHKIDAQLRISGETADFKSGRIDVGNGSLYYEEAGSGEPVIFVHGHSLDHRMWDEQFAEFAKEYRVIRYDLRGYGASSSQTEDYQFTHVQDLVTLMDSLHIRKAHIVGLSLGGFIGADMLGWFPERMASAFLASGNIRKSKGPSQPMTKEEALKRDEEIAALKVKGVDVMKREWFEGLMSSGGTRKERMRQPLWEMIDDWDAWQPLHKEVRVVAGLDAYEAIKKNHPTVPTLIVEGKSPNNRYSNQPEILKYLPNGKLKVLEDCGHMLNMEQPEAFNAALREFLKQ